MENFLMFLRCKREKLQKLWLMSKWTFLFVFLGIINTHGTVYSQNEQQVTISMKNAYLKDILWEIQRQTTFVFMYHEEDLDKVGKVNVEAKSLTVEKILRDCLKGTGLTYVFQNEVIVLKPLNDEKKKEIRIVGKVMDKGKMPLPGVTVVVKGTNLGTATDSEGKYRMVLPAMRDTNFVLVFSFGVMRRRPWIQQLPMPSVEAARGMLDMAMEQSSTHTSVLLSSAITTIAALALASILAAPTRLSDIF
mgnify:CR=1 FL=1